MTDQLPKPAIGNMLFFQAWTWITLVAWQVVMASLRGRQRWSVLLDS